MAESRRQTPTSPAPSCPVLPSLPQSACCWGRHLRAVSPSQRPHRALLTHNQRILFTGEMNLATSSTPLRLMDNQPPPETSLSLCEFNAWSAGQGKASTHQTALSQTPGWIPTFLCWTCFLSRNSQCNQEILTAHILNAIICCIQPGAFLSVRNIRAIFFF